MLNSELKTFYTGRKQRFEAQYRTLDRQAFVLSWLRVASVVLTGLIIYFAFDRPWLWWVATPSLLIFFILVVIHAHRNAMKNLTNGLVRINEEEGEAMAGNHSLFDGGNEFEDPHHPYSFDLDVFGENSLFQRINRTCTEMGKERLAHMLANPLNDERQISARQDAVRELSTRVDFRQTFRAIGRLSREKKEDQDRLIQWLSIDSLLLGNKIMQSVMYVLPALSLIALFYWILNGLATPFIVIGLMQWSLIGLFARRITLFQNYVGDKRFLLETFASHLELIRKETFQSSVLSDAHANSEEACREIRVLAKRVRALDLRLNIFASLLLNTTMLFDLWSVLRLEQWRERNREHLPQWLDAIATMDALNSAGNFAFNHPTFSFPKINQSLSLEGEDVGHPLLDECVTNTISISGKTNVWIVTGANMAGKSTFLRTVGINTVLALCGMPVCASRFQCPRVEVYSGMRNTDSVTDHQSYFLAELLRLQNIMNQFRQGKRLLVLLDEILKGTNSADKLTGSQELIRQLVHVDGLCLVATHDVALGEMATAFPAIQNYHFETFINGEELGFDYKLKPGVSTGKNATFLMKKMGIIA